MSLRVDDTVHKCPEIVDQGSAVVLCAGVAGYRLGQRVDGLDVAVEGRRMRRDGDRGFFERGQLCFDAQSLSSAIRCLASSSSATLAILTVKIEKWIDTDYVRTNLD